MFFYQKKGLTLDNSYRRLRVVAGDGAFGLREWLIKPYPPGELGEDVEIKEKTFYIF